MYAVIGLLNTLLACVVITNVAPKRGRRPWPWIVLAFFVGVLSLIPLYLLPQRGNRGAPATSEA